MAIDIKPKKKKKVELSDSFNYFFYLSALLFVFSIVSYGFVFQWNNQTKERVESKNYILSELQEQSDFKKNQSFINSYGEDLGIYKALLRDRNTLNSVFEIIEKATHPLTYFETVRIDAEDYELRLEGRALNLEALEQQYRIFKDFETYKDISGWIREGQIIEERDEGLVIDGPVTAYDNPVARNEVGMLYPSNDEPVDYLQKINPEMYDLKSVEEEKGERLVVGSWFEIRGEERVNPFESAELRTIRKIDGDFPIEFDFVISLNPKIFK